MSREPVVDTAPAAEGLLTYCRAVEDHLTRVNRGHLVRIVGPSFVLVREWHDRGIPLGIVTRGIDARVERHVRDHAEELADGKLVRPLRVEFCSAEVESLFDRWRRAVGLPRTAHPVDATDVGESEGLGGNGPDSSQDDEASEQRRPSPGKLLDRAIERLAGAAGRLDLPDAFREGVAALIDDLTPVRDRAKGARGPKRDEIMAELPALDVRILELARRTAPDAVRVAARRDAERDLAPYRPRLDEERWARAVAGAAEIRLRELLGLPTLD
jgi:hypothetical protein